jgi:undecaprenyl diphosphate synthase
MELLVKTLRDELYDLQQKGVCLRAIGDLAALPTKCQAQLQESIAKTQDNTRLTVTLALSYSGRAEIVSAVQNLAQQVKEGKLEPADIHADMIERYLFTSQLPDPELLIRTSGEMRLSNFLLWQMAYAEFYFTPVLWPDFRKGHLFDAIRSFQNRERRFGKTSEQISSSQDIP